MAKDAGAKGLIILTDNLDDAIQPYGDYSDNTFLVFIANSVEGQQLIVPKTFIIAAISSSNTVNKKADI